MRIEKDLLGPVELAESALYGVNTVRGVENFPSSGRRLGHHRQFVRAFAHCKWAAALANHELGQLTQAQCEAIVHACREMADGQLDDHLVVDLLEGSGGTSTNMNVNEVIANRAQQLLGGVAGEYTLVHPNDHVNRSQSTNDVYPAAMKVAVHALLAPLADEIGLLGKSLDTKARAFASVLHLGRTCLQDAQPMRLGHLFGGYGSLVERLGRELLRVRGGLTVLPLGGTAIGTGFGSPPGYAGCLFRHLRGITGIEFVPAKDRFDAMQNLDEFSRVSAELRTTAVSIAKIASDLVLLSSGPAGGLNELTLPAVQAGSSIMPGKVNPVVPVSVCQVAYILVGNDACVAQAVQGGQLEINHFEPVVADRIFESIGLLQRSLHAFRTRCVEGIEANVARNEQNLYASTAIATALIPEIGYGATSALVRESVASGEPLSALLIRRGLMTADQVSGLVGRSAEPVPGEGREPGEATTPVDPTRAMARD